MRRKNSNCSCRNIKKQCGARFSAGFSVIELLVTMSIIAILVSGVIAYNHSAERQLILIRERAELIDALNKAKTLSFSTFTGSEPEAPCGIGIHFDVVASEYVLFQDKPAVCNVIDPNFGVYNNPGGDRDIDTVIQLDKSVELIENTGYSDIVFVPPDPRLYFGNAIAADSTFASYKLRIRDTNFEVNIVVNSAGQISYCEKVQESGSRIGECKNN